MSIKKTKKLLNYVEECVDESLAGYLAMNPGLRSLEGYPRIIVRADLEEYKSSGKVTILTGGGSGHEPAFYGNIYLIISHSSNHRHHVKYVIHMFS